MYFIICFTDMQIHNKINFLIDTLKIFSLGFNLSMFYRNKNKKRPSAAKLEWCKELENYSKTPLKVKGH